MACKRTNTDAKLHLWQFYPDSYMRHKRYSFIITYIAGIAVDPEFLLHSSRILGGYIVDMQFLRAQRRHPIPYHFLDVVIDHNHCIEVHPSTFVVSDCSRMNWMCGWFVLAGTRKSGEWYVAQWLALLADQLTELVLVRQYARFFVRQRALLECFLQTQSGNETSEMDWYDLTVYWLHIRSVVTESLPRPAVQRESWFSIPFKRPFGSFVWGYGVVQVHRNGAWHASYGCGTHWVRRRWERTGWWGRRCLEWRPLSFESHYENYVEMLSRVFLIHVK
jgi:hypothetical protein